MAQGELWLGLVEGEAEGESSSALPHAGAGEAALGIPLLEHQHGPRILQILDARAT